MNAICNLLYVTFSLTVNNHSMRVLNGYNKKLIYERSSSFQNPLCCLTHPTKTETKMASSKVAKSEHIDVFLYLADAIIHETTPDVIEPYVDDNFPKDRIEEYATQFPRPATLPQFREHVLNAINGGASNSVTSFIMLFKLLDSVYLPRHLPILSLT